MDPSSPNAETRSHALEVYRKSVDVAAILGADGAHEDYDLHRCFTIGRDAGFRGPWCIEHWNSDWPALRRELKFLRDRIGPWSQSD